MVDDTWNSRVITNLNSSLSRLQQSFSTELEGQSRAGKSHIIIWKMAMNFNVYAVQFGYWSPLSAGSVSVYLQISWIFFTCTWLNILGNQTFGALIHLQRGCKKSKLDS